VSDAVLNAAIILALDVVVGGGVKAVDAVYVGVVVATVGSVNVAVDSVHMLLVLKLLLVVVTLMLLKLSLFLLLMFVVHFGDVNVIFTIC